MIDDKTHRIDWAWRIQRAQQLEAEEMAEKIEVLEKQVAELAALVRDGTGAQRQAQRRPRRAVKPTK
jgi:hypothetical protein